MESLEEKNSAALHGQEAFSGTLERVVFHNEENGWTVFRMNVEGREDPVTVVGPMDSPQPGMRLRVSGCWVSHPRFGRQLQLESWEEEMPATAEGIRLFLASGCIRGIGPKWAERIVSAFGAETLEIMDKDPDRMLEIPKFGKKRLASMKASWEEHQGIRQLMLFLQPHGVAAGLAARIYRHYGTSSLAVVRENPYRLAMDIHGIGFLTADSLARKIGFAEDSPLRAEAGVLYTLMGLTEEGHVYCPRDVLSGLAAEKLSIPENLADDAIEDLAMDERVVLEDLGDHQAVYLSRFHYYESTIAYYMRRLIRSPKSVCLPQAKRIVEDVLSRLPISLAEEQKRAVLTAAREKVMVLTGGPGTGKTTIINAIIKVFQEARAKILLAAPTGRAAKRMSETTGLEAKTIHRLLEYSPAEDGFKRNEDNPLACGLLVVDEASMMDTMLMCHLVKAAPLGATFVLVGDVDQLPSVGPGNVLRDVIASRIVPVVELNEVFRQAAESSIIRNAHLINSGQIPELKQKGGAKTDFYFFRQDDPEAAADLVVELVCSRIPRTFGFRPEDIQVLSPMLRGAVGVNSLNRRLQDAVNPQRVRLTRGDRQFRLHDRVMQLRNNYDKDVYNGDMGVITYLDAEEREMTVRFDERSVSYQWEDMDELIPAYAISIHKSQGGEYPVVVIPLMMQHYMLLQRNLVYTAVTRGRKLVVLVGEWKALAIAVKNNHMRTRYTWLAHRLAGEAPEPWVPGRPASCKDTGLEGGASDAER